MPKQFYQGWKELKTIKQKKIATDLILSTFFFISLMVCYILGTILINK